MSDTNNQFTVYVNLELPKRISTEDSPMAVVPGTIPVATGLGLQVEFKDPLELIKGPESFEELGVGLVTAEHLPLSGEGTVELPSRPYGGVLLNMAMVHLADESVVEVVGVTLDGRTLTLQNEDLVQLNNPVAVTVSYLGDLTAPQ